MKTLLLAGAAPSLVAAASLSPAMAQANSPSHWNASQALYQPTGQEATDAVAPSQRYEYQYHYGGSPRHPRWELQRVPVR
jgi:hypothetical protein